MNSAGLGLCVNALISHHDAFRPSVPFWVLARSVLNSRTIEEARAAVERAERVVSGNMLIASDQGEVIDLEITPVDVACIEPTNGVLSHANSFERLGAGRNVTDKWERLRPQMKLRAARAQEILRERGQDLDIESFKAFFRDHTTESAPICSHPNPDDPDDLRSQTVVSVIMDLNVRAMHIAEGPPCAHEYQRLTFQSLSN